MTDHSTSQVTKRRRTVGRRRVRGTGGLGRVVAVIALTVPAVVFAYLPVTAAVSTSGVTATATAAAASCPVAPDPGCSVTIDARDFATGTPLHGVQLPDQPGQHQAADDPLALSTESNSPIVREGNEGHAATRLPAGRYLISVRARDHKMWGQHITLPNPATADGSLIAHIDLTEQSEAHPLPLGKIRVFVFQDNAWANGAPDTEEGPLQGFQVGLEEQTHSAVTVDYNNTPLCGGICKTDAEGFSLIDNLGPATYFIDVHPPEGPCNSDPSSAWYQTTTIDGGLQLLAPVEEGSDGTGAPGEQLWEPPTRADRVLVRVRLRTPGFRDRRHRRDHRHRPQLGGVGAVHHRHLRRSRSRTRSWR